MRDPAAEAAFLGAAVLGSPSALEAVDRLDVEDFTEPRHARVFDAVRGLHRRGERVEPIALLAELRRLGHVHRWGDGQTVGLFILALQEQCPLPASGGFYAEVMLENSVRRQVQLTGRRLQQAAEGGGSVDDLRHLAAAEVSAVMRALGRVTAA